jgi:hypothetical protein
MKSDLVVWRPGNGTWFWLTSGSGYNTSGSKQWGAQNLGDVPLMETDGDSIRPRRVAGEHRHMVVADPSSGYNYAAQGSKAWGARRRGRPMLGDIDGDGKADLIVWRASNATCTADLASGQLRAQGSRQWGSQSPGCAEAGRHGWRWQGGPGRVARLGHMVLAHLVERLQLQPGGRQQWGSQACHFGDLDGDGKS